MKPEQDQGLGRRLLWRAFGVPEGLLGRLGGRIMAGKRKTLLVEEVLRLLDVKPGDHVLEVGFGPGVGIELAAGRLGKEGRVVGVDLSEVMLRMASERNSEAIREGRVRLELGSAERLPVPDGAFDKAFSMNSMHLWRDADAGLREIRRALKQGGRLVLSFDGPAKREIALESVPERLVAAGFSRTGTSTSFGAHFVWGDVYTL